MSYIDHVIQPGESIVYRAPLHWVIYTRGLGIAAVGVAITAAGLVTAQTEPSGSSDLIPMAIAALGVLVLGLAAISLAGSFIRRRTTEIAVTSKRVIYKTGFVRRLTSELSVDKIETVLVDQSVLGRVFNFGTVIVRGTGGGLEPVPDIDDPLTFRSRLTAR